jgi:VanZ family protein
VLNKRWYSFFYLVWLLVLVYLSLRPNLKGPGIQIPYFDKLAHLGFYFVASLLFLTALDKTSLVSIKTTNKILWTLLIHLLLGGVIEVIQEYYVSGRSGEFADFLANATGISIAILLYSSRWNYFSRSN